MNKFIQIYLSLFLMVLGFSAQASVGFDPAGFAEKQIVVQWVQEKAHKTVTSRDIAKVVMAAYKYAEIRQLDPLLLIAVMRQESHFRTHAKGGNSVGLMQVLPYWHKDKIAGRNIMDPDVNVDVGSEIMRLCLKDGRGSLKAAIRCYTGGAPETYLRNIRATMAELDRVIRQQNLDRFLEVLDSRPTVLASLK